MARNGFNGPIPKRSDERIRRNKTEVEIDQVQPIVETVEAPELGISNPHRLVVDLYESLKDSAQSRYYEPSDWQFARLTCHFLNQQVKSGKPSGQMLATLMTSLSNLMTTEGDRRRLRMEIERNNEPSEGGKVLEVADMFRQRFAGGS